MEDKGFVLESDHPYAYEMQYSDAYDDVVELQFAPTAGR